MNQLPDALTLCRVQVYSDAFCATLVGVVDPVTGDYDRCVSTSVQDIWDTSNTGNSALLRCYSDVGYPPLQVRVVDSIKKRQPTPAPYGNCLANKALNCAGAVQVGEGVTFIGAQSLQPGICMEPKTNVFLSFQSHVIGLPFGQQCRIAVYTDRGCSNTNLLAEADPLDETCCLQCINLVPQSTTTLSVLPRGLKFNCYYSVLTTSPPIQAGIAPFHLPQCPYFTSIGGIKDLEQTATLTLHNCIAMTVQPFVSYFALLYWNPNDFPAGVSCKVTVYSDKYCINIVSTIDPLAFPFGLCCQQLRLEGSLHG
jgi:hypothetical protein